jgi:hypothetical protein
MSGVSELLFRYEVTAECLAEACLNYEQYSSVMDPYAEDDDLEVFFFSPLCTSSSLMSTGDVHTLCNHN